MSELIFGNLKLLIVSLSVGSIAGAFAAIVVWKVLSKDFVDHKLHSHIFLLLSFLLAGLALVLFSANIPYDDDYNCIVAYLAHPWPTRLCHLIDYNWEHRVGLTNLCAELMVDVTGRINFQWLDVLGLSFAAAIAYLFMRRLNFYGKAGCFVATALFWLLLSPLSDYFFWPMASIQNNGVLLLVFLSLVVLNASNGGSLDCRFVAAMILAVASTFTSGSGMIVWPIMVAMLCFKGNWRSAVVRIGVLVVVALVSIGYYFHEPWVGQSAREQFSLLHALAYFFTFAGAWTCMPGVAFVAGVVICAFIGYLVPRVNRLKHPDVYFFALYILATMAAGSLFRSGRIINALPPRHPELPFALLGCVFVLAFEQLNIGERVKQISVSCLCGYAVCLNVFAFGFFGSIWHSRIEIDRRNLLIRPYAVENLTSIHGPWQNHAVDNLMFLEEHGIYDSRWNLKEGESVPQKRIDPGDFWTPGRRTSKCNVDHP